MVPSMSDGRRVGKRYDGNSIWFNKIDTLRWRSKKQLKLYIKYNIYKKSFNKIFFNKELKTKTFNKP